MKTESLRLRNKDFTLPSTMDFTYSYFHCLSHDIIQNTTESRIEQFGHFVCNLDYSHDQVERATTLHGKQTVLTGGIDKRLTSICNFTPKASGIALLKDSFRSPTERNWINEVASKLKSKAQQYVSNRRMPEYYTGAFKHKWARVYLKKAVAMIIKLETSYLFYAVIGDIEYEFEFTPERETEKGMINARHSVFKNSLIGDIADDFDFDFDFDDDIEEECNAELVSELVQPQRIAVTSSCELRYDVELKNTYEASDEELESVLASLDDEYELMMIEEDAKKRRLESLHYKGVC
ncbi:hypothetical protein ACVD1N_05965 [Vibrio parahaemolyticus]